MSGDIEVIIGVVGVVVFTMVFMAGVAILQGRDDRGADDG